MLFMESDTGSEMARVGLLRSWGGTIVEASFNGTNYVNSNDPGRQVQVSLWDGDSSYTPDWGYNPVQAGDHCFQGSPVLAQTVDSESIYVKTQPIQWAPESFGGNCGSPVLGDAYIEQWLTPVAGRGRAFKVHYKITHFGSDTHTNSLQELPVAYVNRGFDTFVYYGGSSPWTYGAVTRYTMPLLPDRSPSLYAPEQWGARPVTYELRHQQTAPSRYSPFGFLEEPVSGTTISGNAASVGGWVVGTSPVTDVQVVVDGAAIGAATYGIPRPDVPQGVAGQSVNAGFEYALDTTKLSNGAHNLTIKVTDTNGNIAIFPTCHVSVSNR